MEKTIELAKLTTALLALITALVKLLSEAGGLATAKRKRRGPPP